MIPSAILACILLAPQASEPPQEQPNIVVINADDVGIDQVRAYDDLNHYSDPLGYAYPNTPTLDTIVSAGVRFTQARAQPRCSLTRAAVLTGLYPFQSGQGELAKFSFRGPNFLEIGGAVGPQFPEYVPLPFLLGAYGYETGAFGKWHLGLDADEGGIGDEHARVAFAFDEFRGTPRNLAGMDAPPGGSHYDFWWVENGVRAQVTGPWITSYTVDRALDWIGTTSEPFFAWISFPSAHVPVQGANWAPGNLHGFGGVQQGLGNTAYRASVEAMDAELGRFLQSMDAEKRERTVFLFLGDNGTQDYVWQPDPVADVRYPVNHPLHVTGDESTPVDVSPYDPLHAKGSVYDSGYRVPLVLFGDPYGSPPGGLVASPGRDSASLIDCVDIYATCAELAGLGQTSSLASGAKRFGAVLSDPSWIGDRDWSLGERFSPNGVGSVGARVMDNYGYIRVAPGGVVWKLVRRIGGDEFYRLDTDPLETTDLGAGHPEFQATVDDLNAILGGG